MAEPFDLRRPSPQLRLLFPNEGGSKGGRGSGISDTAKRAETRSGPRRLRHNRTVLPKYPSAFAAPDTSWGRAAGCVKSRSGEMGTLLCSHPLSAGRDFRSRALDWTQSVRQATCPSEPAGQRRLPLGGGSRPRRFSPGAAPPRPTGVDPESGPVAPAPRRSPGVLGSHVPVYRSPRARGVH